MLRGFFLDIAALIEESPGPDRKITSLPVTNHREVNTHDIGAKAQQLGPIAESNRIDAMDILRGFALGGILLMNIEWFSRSLSALGTQDTTLTGMDHAAGWLVRCVVVWHGFCGDADSCERERKSFWRMVYATYARIVCVRNATHGLFLGRGHPA